MTALGASLVEDTVVFRVWAPRCRALDVVLAGRPPAPLAPGADGLFEGTLGDVAPGARYRYRLDGARHRPDPASRWQPEGVPGPAAGVGPRGFGWAGAALLRHTPP